MDGTMKDWDGDPVYCRVENGTLIGEVRDEDRKILDRMPVLCGRRKCSRSGWQETELVAVATLCP
jgi:hypothetical protein